MSFDICNACAGGSAVYARGFGRFEISAELFEKATADKGGHRQNALDLVSRAISSVNNGIAYDQQNPNNRRRRNNDVDLSENNFVPVADQYNMQQAKNQLQSALNNLQKASPDKGGYRTQAIDLVRDAISETQKGIDYDRRN